MRRACAWRLAVVALVVGLAPPSAQAADHGSYFLIRPDTRTCPAPACGGYYARRVNQQETRCGDGKFAAECYVAVIEPAAGAALSGDTIRRAIDRSPARAAVVRATGLIRSSEPTDFHLVFLATEAWRAIGREPPTGDLWIVDDAGITCAKAPCPTLRARRLGESETRLVSEVDLDRVFARKQDLEKVFQALPKEAVVLSGAVRVGTERGADVFVANQAWIKP